MYDGVEALRAATAHDDASAGPDQCVAHHGAVRRVALGWKLNVRVIRVCSQCACTRSQQHARWSMQFCESKQLSTAGWQHMLQLRWAPFTTNGNWLI